MNVIYSPLDEQDYFKIDTLSKKWICLHHTVSRDAFFDLQWWGKTAEKVATSFLIQRSGEIIQCFDDKYWAWHLGLKDFNEKDNINFNKQTVGIEIVNLGPVRESFPERFEYNYRGFKHWQPYTDMQYLAVAEVLKHLWGKYDIPKTICDSLEFDLTVFVNYGVFSHRNVNRTKSDVSPAFDFGKLREKLIWIGA